MSSGFAKSSAYTLLVSQWCRLSYPSPWRA